MSEQENEKKRARRMFLSRLLRALEPCSPRQSMEISIEAAGKARATLIVGTVAQAQALREAGLEASALSTGLAALASRSGPVVVTPQALTWLIQQANWRTA